VLESIETRWAIGAASMFRASELPRPSLWPAVLHQAPGIRYVEPVAEVSRPKVAVRVNHGVWQTLCPFCPSAQHAAETDRFFYCGECMNEGNGHRLLPVVWPADWEAIAAELVLRPRAENRNWLPGETVAQLRSEALERMAV
jgi:hypothetical protein